MGLSRRFGSSAISLLAVAPLFLAAPSFAQYSTFADDALVMAGLDAGPLSRSPSLIGMGRLTLVGQDPHYRLNLWDFAGNPTGVATAESVSTLDLRPGGGGASDVQDLSGASAGRIREDFAARLSTMGYEMWRREGAVSYGAIGNFGSLQYDRPYSDDVERRITVGDPRITPIFTGLLPYTKSGRTRYAVRLHWSQERVDTKYMSIVQNAAGDFISLDSEHLTSPYVFFPESYLVHQIGAGLAVSQSFGPLLNMALGYDGVSASIQGSTDEKRSSSQTHEERPYNILQASGVGRVGKSFEWGQDLQVWRSISEIAWNFSLSAGQGAAPLNGRGKLLNREEEAMKYRARAILHVGAVDFGGGVQTLARRTDLTPPNADDLTSFNYFLNTTFYRQGADSLALPDSVVRDRSELHAWEAGGGFAVHLAHRRGLLGFEYHRARSLYEAWTSGTGPRSVRWDVRSGLEYALTPGFVGRAGYRYVQADEDEFTAGNEYRTHQMSFGMGVTPQGAHWTVDLSYALALNRADYGSQSQPRGSRQQLASQVHWAF